MSFLFKILHLNFHSFSGFQYGSDSSIEVIMPLSAALPLAIGLKFLVCYIESKPYLDIFPRS